MAPSLARTLSQHLSSAAGTARRVVTRKKTTGNHEDFVIIGESHIEANSQNQPPSTLADTPDIITPEEAEAVARQELDDEYAKVVAIAAARGANQSTFSAVKDVVAKTAEHINRLLHPPKIPTPEEAQCPCWMNPDDFYACYIQEHVSAGFKRLREKNKAMK